MTGSFRKVLLTCAVIGICSGAETIPQPVTKDDQRGTLNLITPARRKQARALVKDGVSISLAHDIDRVKTADRPRPLSAEMTLDAAGHAMDLYTFWYHGSIITHIDALCHYSFEGKPGAKLGPWNAAASAAGFDATVMPWLHKRDVALLGNDAVEDAQPSGVEGVARPIHQLAIAALGLPLIDVMDLEAVAAECERRHKWEFSNFLNRDC